MTDRHTSGRDTARDRGRNRNRVIERKRYRLRQTDIGTEKKKEDKLEILREGMRDAE